MGKYLDDPILNEALENYFNNLEAVNEGKLIDKLKDIFKSKKNIKIDDNFKVSDEIKKEADKALDILISKLKELQSSKEYKNIINDLYSNNKISSEDKNIKLYNDIYKKVIKEGNKYLYCVGIFSNMSQDMFYLEASNGKHIFDLTDKLFKDLKSNKEIISLPHYNGMYNADDFLAITINFNID